MWRNMNLTAGGRPILGTPFVGLLGAQIIAETTTGDDGPGLMANDGLASDKRYRIVLQEAFGTDGFVSENGDFTVTAPATTSYLLYEDNILVSGTATQVNIATSTGAVTFSVTGQATVKFTAVGGVNTSTSAGGDPVSMSAAGLAQVVFAALGGVATITYGGEGNWLSKRRVKVTSAGDYISYQLLDYEEIDNVAFDFSGEMLAGEVIASAVSEITLKLGSGSLESVLPSQPRIQGSEVVQRVQGVTPNTAYTLRMVVDLNSGRRLVGSVLLSFGIK